MSNWISVKDRVPEDGQEVDVWQKGIFNWRETNVIYEKYDGFYHNNEKLNDVTHWMPLPAPPEDK